MNGRTSIEHSRQVRAAILRVLWTHDQAGLAIGYTAAELANLNADSVFGVDGLAIGQEIRQLTDDLLVERVAESNPPRFVITGDGRDFCRADMPWAQVDRFTGRENPAG